MELFNKPLQWLKQRGLGSLHQASKDRTCSSDGPRVDLDFPACIEREYPEWFPAAWGAVEKTLEVIKDADLTPLERRSPGLKGYGWDRYLRCSVVRMVHAAQALYDQGIRGGHLLDYGSYFGNFALMFAKLGYQVHAVDSYAQYGRAFTSVTRSLEENGIEVHDSSEHGFGSDPGEKPSILRYDVVVSAGVIEHVPHTPRYFLETLNALLKPSGWLLLDTPNLAYLYTRQKLARGETIFCPISCQYGTELPFEGHHREYTTGEMRWMLEQLGHRDIAVQTFNYSLYGAPVLLGLDAANYRQMMEDPSAREVILTVSRKAS